VDLDADGACGSPGEIGGPTTDCDDSVFGPSCLSRAAGPTEDGALPFVVTGAVPGSEVMVMMSTRLGDTCPAPFHGSCLQLRRPRQIGAATADGTGTATVWFVVSSVNPATPRPRVLLQAAVMGSGRGPVGRARRQ
jgi:hypothetical protein